MRHILIIVFIFLFSLTIYSCSSSSDDGSSTTTDNDSTTTDTTPPTVSSSSPSDGDTSVSITSNVSVTFSETMDTSSVSTNTLDTSCFGTYQVSSDGFSSCVQMSSSPTSSNSDKTFTITPKDNLSYSTVYRIRISTSTKDISGNSLGSEWTTSSGFQTGTEPDTTPPTVSSTYPSDNDTSVSNITSISVTFSESMDTTTVNTNTLNTSCSDSLQVSSDNFSGCVQMSSSPSVSNSYKTFGLNPSDNLSYSTNYKIRVTTTVKDSSGNSLGSEWTTSSGFQTGNVPDNTSPTVSSIYPTDNSTSISVSDNVSVTFSESMDTTTVNTNTDNTTCYGSLQVSSDNFSSCVQMSSTPSISNSYKTFGLNPSNNFSYTKTYKIKITTGVKDNSNNSMESSYISSVGFTTPWKTHQIGTVSNEVVSSMTIDSNNNIYLTGYTEGGLENNSNSGGEDIFLVKLNSYGVVEWVKQLGTSSDERGYSLDVDSNDNVLMTGFTGGGLNGNTHQGNDDYIMIKFDSSGNTTWTKQFGSSGMEEGKGIITDSSNNIYLVGYNYIFKYDSNGDGLSQVTYYSPSGSSTIDDISIDNSSNIFLSGFTSGSFSGFTNKGNHDIFVSKLNSSLTHQWTQQYGTTDTERDTKVTVDLNNNVYITGYTGGGLDNNTHLGGSDVFLFKFNNEGTKQWSKQFGTSSGDVGTIVRVDSSGNVYVTGFTGGGMDGSNQGSSDIFLVKFNSSGTKLWTRQLGTSSGDGSYGMEIDTNGNIFISGSTLSGLDGNDHIGGSDIFIVKYDSSGTKQ